MAATTPRPDRLLKVVRVLQECTSTLMPEKLHFTIVNTIHRELGPYYLVSFFRIDRAKGTLTTVANAGDSLLEFYAKHGGQYTQSVQAGVIGHVARTGETRVVHDTAKDPFFQFPDWTPPQTRSELCVPVKADGESLALINIESEALDAFSEEDVVLLEILAEHLGQCIRNAQLHDTLLQKTQRYREVMADARHGQRKLAALLGLFPTPPFLLDAEGHLTAVVEARDGAVRWRPPSAGAAAHPPPATEAGAAAWRSALDEAQRAGGTTRFVFHRKAADGSARDLAGRLCLLDPTSRAESLFVPGGPDAGRAAGGHTP
ncbi:MAG: GAF domain-containing protein [Planctomycetes bacterium]|nr:GAF domain-containing protein [Planctomycetota bacterium]